jgi:hypothetical protein
VFHSISFSAFFLFLSFILIFWIETTLPLAQTCQGEPLTVAKRGCNVHVFAYCVDTVGQLRIYYLNLVANTLSQLARYVGSRTKQSRQQKLTPVKGLSQRVKMGFPPLEGG